MSLDSNNYFEIFSLPLSFTIAESDLDREYKNLQAKFHPDKFAGSDDSDRVLAVRQASLINDAYATLKSPLKRAAYLLKLNGTDPEEHNQEHLDGEFLIQQMELREKLEEFVARDDADGLEDLKRSAAEEKRCQLKTFESLYVAGEFGKAKSIYHKLQFLFKLLDEIDTAEEKLLDY